MSLPATPRLLVEQDLAAGQIIPFSRTQAHYLQRVLRRRHGDSVRLFNGRDGEWLAHIDTKASQPAGHLQDQLREQPPPPAPLTLFFAPIKRTRQEILIEKAVEMGATSPATGENPLYRRAFDQARPGQSDYPGSR